MDDPLLRFVEQLILVDEALPPEEDAGDFIKNLLRVRQALLDHEALMPESSFLPNWNSQAAKSKEIGYGCSGAPVGLQRCESDDDVPLPADWHEKTVAALQQATDEHRRLNNWCNDKPNTDE